MRLNFKKNQPPVKLTLKIERELYDTFSSFVQYLRDREENPDLEEGEVIQEVLREYTSGISQDVKEWRAHLKAQREQLKEATVEPPAAQEKVSAPEPKAPVTQEPSVSHESNLRKAPLDEDSRARLTQVIEEKKRGSAAASSLEVAKAT